MVLKYSPCGENSGHYECLVKITGQVRLPILSSIARRLPVLPATPALVKLSRKVEHSHILTTSPYKTKTKQQTNSGRKQKIQKNVSKRKSVASVKRKGNIKYSKNNCTDINDWHCFMCNECRVENMICIRSCRRWAHEDCAGTNEVNFICELC